MTRIDFYLLTGVDASQRYMLVGRLAEKAIAQQEKVFIFSENQDELKRLDDLLWDLRPVSFIPHDLVLQQTQTASNMGTPVVLSSGEPDLERTILINLHYEVPAFFSRFHRTLEVIDESPAIQAPGRDRYRYYQQRGYPLRHHKM